jgi:NAD+ synthase
VNDGPSSPDRTSPIDLHLEELDIDMATVEKILLTFIREECRVAGYDKGVLGLSGGLDSAVVCALAARALGRKNVTAVVMPSSTSSARSLEDAQLVIDQYRLNSRTVDITPMAEGYLATAPNLTRVRQGNIYARCRMIVLFDVSAELHALVLGTSNKTELLLGYGTLHGDMASGINPIGDLYKSQVRALGKHLGIPNPILEKEPSADLWAGQRDVDELGATYEMLDMVLYRMIDQRYSIPRLIEFGFDPKFVRSVRDRVRRNQFKRRTAIIAKLSSRTIGPDFRLPRDAAFSLDRDGEVHQ